MIMKKFLSLLLAALLIVQFVPAVFASDSAVFSLEINPYGGEQDSIDTVSWYKNAEGYYLFLPADFEPDSAKVYVSSAAELDGDMITADSGELFTEGTHTLTCGGESYALTVLRSANIPAVFISTESGSLEQINQNKSVKEKGNIRIYENGELTLDSALKQIKGRGNATWGAPKKPYNIKFDKKTSLFGIGKAKKWTLLANYYDVTLARNPLAWYLAERAGLDFTPEYQHVDLFVNGEYLGNYIICESVEVGSERVDIADLESMNEDANPDVDLETLPQVGTGAHGAVLSGSERGSAKWIEVPNDPDDISGGYILEYDTWYYNGELCGFVTDNGQPVVVKTPEIASRAEVEYVRTFVNSATNAIYSSSGYNSEGKNYADYYDIDSLAAMYIVQEFSSNIDAGMSSLFAYKDVGSDKIVFGPAWDFDHAFGDSIGRFGANCGDADAWWANGTGLSIRTVLGAAYMHEEFRDVVRAKWTELKNDSFFEDLAGFYSELTADLSASATMNIIRWYGKKDAASAQAKYVSEVSNGAAFMETRTAALSKGFSENAAMLYYDANGGSSFIFDPTIAVIGDTLTVLDTVRYDKRIDPPDSLHTFGGWSLSPDGSGRVYQPGDSITLTSKTTTLYAVWNMDSPTSISKKFFSRILDFFKKIVEFFKKLFK